MPGMMGLGLMLVEMLVRAGGVAPAFSPSSLANLQLLLNLGDTSTLRQDAAGTTPVVSDGDPVGRATDASAQARTHTAAGIVRPLYRTVAMAGLPCGQHDGTDDCLAAVTPWVMAGAQTWTLDFQLTAAIGGGAFACLGYLADGTTSCVLYVCNSPGYPSVTFQFGYTAVTACVGFGAINGGALDLLRHRLVIAYNGLGSSNPANYAATLDGVAQTIAATGTASPLAAGSAFGAYPNSSFPTPVRLRKIALHSANHSASAAQLDGWANAA